MFLLRVLEEGRLVGLIAEACLVKCFGKCVLAFSCRVRQFRVRAHLVRHRGCHSYDESYSRGLVPCFRLDDFRRGLYGTGVEGMLSSLARVRFALDDLQAVILAPFARALSWVVPVPRPPVRCNLRPFVPDLLLLLNGDTLRVEAGDFFMAFRRNACVLESSNAPFSLRSARTDLCRLVRGVGDFRVFEERSMFVIRLRFGVALFVLRVMYATACLRADPPIDEDVRLVRARVALTQRYRARYPITRRLGASRFSVQAFGLFLLSDVVGRPRLLRVRFAYRCRCVNGTDVGFRHSNVASVWLNKGICFLPRLTAVDRCHRVHDGRNASTYLLDHVRGNARRDGVFVVGGNVSHGVTLSTVFVASLYCLTWVVSDGYANEAYARVRALGSRMGEVHAYLCNYHRQLA